MVKLRSLFLLLVAGFFLSLPTSHAVSTNLVFDSLLKEYTVKPGEVTAEFDFSLTNTGPVDVSINMIRPSCGCTTPRLPPLPWKLAPSESGSFHLTVDLRGKFGIFQKSVFLETTEGPKMVYIKCILPNAGAAAAAVPGMDSRTRNMQLAHADRQIVFRNDCANCHSKPAIGKRGEALFTAACAICHEAEHRAALVPDLQALKQPPTEAYWEAWIRHGKVGTMMPAFALDQQGPLDDEQIKSLVAYLMKDFPNRKPLVPSIPVSTASRPATVPQPLPALPGSQLFTPSSRPAEPSAPPSIPTPIAPSNN